MDAREEAIKTLKENICANCAYGMPFDTCDISYCDNREAIKELEQEQYYKDLANSYEKTINKLTKAISEQEPKTGWIPCSERLPELHQKVIATYVTEDGANIAITYYDKYGFLIGEVIAWKPLPKPYKAESEVENVTRNQD